jgi:hypothetical protein
MFCPQAGQAFTLLFTSIINFNSVHELTIARFLMRKVNKRTFSSRPEGVIKKKNKLYGFP